MIELSHWKDLVVPQKNKVTGCIPASYEWMIKYVGTNGIDFETFQEKFDLKERNSFKNVAAEINEAYPSINIKIKDDFKRGQEKIEFVRRLLSRDIPCLISIKKTVEEDLQGNYHILRVVSINDQKLSVIWDADDSNMVKEFTLDDVISRHNNFEGGKDVAWIQKKGNAISVLREIIRRFLT